MNTKYNYVFYNINEECYDPVFCPLEKLSFVKVYKHAFEADRFTNKLFFLHWSAKMNRAVKLPFKKIWYKKIFRNPFSDNKPCCYVFLGGKYLTQVTDMYSYIKNLNPENKAVVLCGDLIAKKNWDMDKIRRISDDIITYDEGEAEKYSVGYMPWTSGYGAITEVTMPEEFEYDVYFLGFAKDRLEKIHEAYKHLSAKGLRCKFIICGTREEARIEGEGLCYCDPIPYRKHLEILGKSRCSLEILQGGSSAPTLRPQESYAYRRKLITNNTNPVYRELFDQSNLCVFADAEDIPKEFAVSPVNYEKFDSNKENAPIKLIELLEERLG